MMRSTFAGRLFLLSILIGGLNASTAMAGEASPALVSAGRNVLEWAPVVDFESITLSFADPQGLVRTHRFGPGEAPVLSLFDAQGNPLPDGTYTWELRVTPRRSAVRPVAPLAQSGYFTISNGSLVPSDLIEPPEKIITAEDQVVPDDLVVDGKGCIGLGCANNEAFFSEALRLKQSVVRLRFVDTSVAAGLPTGDWQLTVNDAASGGADRFSIDDLTAGTTPFTVRGGAPSNALYVSGAGNVGLGTATPSGPLHLFGSATADVFAGMGVDLSAGPAFNYGYAGASFGRSAGFFNIRPDASATAPNPSLRFMTSNVQRMIIDNEGFVGLGGTSFNPAHPIHHEASGARLTAGGVWTAASSRALKQDIRKLPADDALSALAHLVPVRFRYKAAPDDESMGFIAEDVPDLVATADRKTLSPMDIVAVLTRVVQELTSRNEELVARLEGVEEQRRFIEKQQELIGRLEERLRRLEAEKNPKQLAVVDQR